MRKLPVFLSLILAASSCTPFTVQDAFCAEESTASPLDESSSASSWTEQTDLYAYEEQFTTAITEFETFFSEIPSTDYSIPDFPSTEPSATEPPVTETPATEPPATESPATEPPVTEPPVTEPSAAESSAAESSISEPSTLEIPTSEITASEETVMESSTTEFTTLESSASESSTLESSTLESTSPESSVPESTTIEPATSETESTTAAPAELQSPVVSLTVNDTNSAVLIQWTASTGSDGYYIYKKVPGERWAYYQTVSPDVQSFTDSIGPGAYSYAVRAYRYVNNRQELSDFQISMSASITILPEKSCMQSVKINSNGGIDLQWEQKSQLTGYGIFRKTYNENWVLLTSIENPQTTSYTDTTALVGQYYAYTVRTFFKQNSKTFWGNYNSGIRYWVPLNTPHLLSVSQVSGSSLQLTWNAVDGADGYQVFRKEPGVRWATIDFTDSNTPVYTDSTTDYAKKYSYTVRAYRQIGNTKFLSGYENGLSQKAILSVPTLNAAQNMYNGIAVSWNPVDFAEGYYLYRKTNTSNWTMIKQLDQTASSYSDTSLPSRMTSNRVIWIGDSRFVGMQSAIQTSDDQYIALGAMYWDWFNSSAVPQLESMLSWNPVCSVVINMGVNDCANYIVGSSTDYINLYVNKINYLVQKYPNTDFYFMSVNPVRGYYHGWLTNISPDVLGNQINIFNYAMRTRCNCTYIDTYNYLNQIGYTSYDGIHYSASSNRDIYYYARNYLTSINTPQTYTYTVRAFVHSGNSIVKSGYDPAGVSCTR